MNSAVHPAHQSAREAKAGKLVETLLEGTFGKRTPTGDEIRHVLAQMVLTPRAWLTLAIEAGWGDMTHETRGIVCGMLMRLADEADAAPKLRSVPRTDEATQRLYAAATTNGDTSLATACAQVLAGAPSSAARAYVASALKLSAAEARVT